MRTLTIVSMVVVLICSVVVLYHVFQRVEGYADYMEGMGVAMYDMKPSQFNIFLINLDSKTDRLDNFIRAYKSTDLYPLKVFERVSAVNGRELDLRRYVSDHGLNDIDMIETRGFRIKHNQLTRGAVGCYLSHMEMYKKIRERPEPYSIIFEDDIKFSHRDVYRRLRIEMAKMPDDWDILLMGCVCHVCKNHGSYKDLDHFFLLHAYVIKREGAIKILNALEYMPVRQQIDSELSVMAIENKLKIYCLNPSLVWQDPAINKTSIQLPMKILKGVNPYSLS